MAKRIHLVLLLLAGSLSTACSTAESPQLVLTGGTIHTLEPEQPVAEALAVRDGRIVAVGDDTDVLQLIGEGTQVIDLEGAVVYPGFTDSHVHLRGVGERELAFNLEGISGISELQERLAAEVAKRQPGDWILGRGWIETHWQPSRFPTREDLDVVAPNNPVALTRADGHALVANSRALEIAGIGPDTQAPFGGEILRDDNGKPTGMLVDNAMDLLADVMPESDIAPRQALVTGAERSARLGWTGLQIAGNDWEEAMLLRDLVKEGAIPVRIYNAIRGPSPSARQLLESGARIAESDGRFTLRTIKVSVDGALGSRGAALLEEYADADTTGLITWREEDLLPLYESALREGIQVETHAIGDRANRFVLDLYEKVFAAVPERERKVHPPRWRIEHAQVLAESDIPRFAELGVIPSMQASHAIGDLHFAPDRLGEERLSGAYAWRRLRDTGVIIPGGSDAPVEQGDPRIEYYAMVARRDLSGEQGENWHPEQALSREEALLSLTAWPAYAAFEEDTRGSIAVGKRADFTILGKDITRIPEAEIPSTAIVMTIVGGRIVYRGDD
ncbi:MAG: amidohydrolase [Proteobacteria bacterium]|nr:amidohydrolase [Pseudomonadota bacterium]